MDRPDPPEEGVGTLGLVERQNRVPVYRLVDLAEGEDGGDEPTVLTDLEIAGVQLVPREEAFPGCEVSVVPERGEDGG